MKLIITLLSILLLNIATVEETLHEYHLSKTEIHHNPKNKTFEITIKLFIDDFGQALEEGSQQKINLGTIEEHKKTDNYIQSYIDKHFFIQTKNKEHEQIFLGKEFEEESVLLFVEVQNIRRTNTIFIHNSILTELFEDQKNLISITVNKNKQGTFLQSGETEKTFTF